MSQYELQKSIATAGTDIPCSGLQKWEIENTDTANSIFLNEQLVPPTAATSGGSEVAAGLTRTFFFDGEENPLIHFKAATAAVLINIRKETFRSRLIFDISRLAAGIAKQVADQFWQRVSAAVVKLAGAYTEARADTVRNKTAGTALTLTMRAATDGISLSDPTGAVTYHNLAGDGTIRQGVGSAQVTVLQAGQYGIGQAVAIVEFAGNQTDPRHTLSSTVRVIHTPVAGGAIASVLETIERPITNAVVIAGGDLVMVSSADGHFIPATTGNVTQPVWGVANVGGTGVAGLTVFARVAFAGWYYGLLADAAGIVGGQFVKPGTTTANRVESQTTPSLITFGRGLITAASGVGTVIALRGGG